MHDIIHGDCLEIMRTMAENSIDCILTDPPYGLSFMGKDWDHGIPGKHFWFEALRICKPGAHLLAFGGTRTYHRLTCAIEDAGWEIRDCLIWLYGSGFPKSHNHFGLPGYGTALKPAYEPIIMAMKPLEGSYAQNAEKWGVAGINIDATRVVSTAKASGRWPANLLLDEEAAAMLDEQSGISISRPHKNKTKGPSGWKNSSDGEAFSNHNDSGGASRFFYCAKASSSERNAGLEGMPLKEKKTLNDYVRPSDGRTAPKCGSPSQNNHPTVKPLALMQYIIKLIMPPNPQAILLDPFAGSGTTIVAAKQLRRNAIGIEISAEYAEIARKRIENAKVPAEQYEMNL